MKEFFTLVSIENTKVWKRLSSKVMIIIMVVLLLAANGIMKYMESRHKGTNTTTVSDNWKEDAQKQLEANKAQLAQMEKKSDIMSKTGKGTLKKTIAESEYRINNDIKPESIPGIWGRVESFDITGIIALLIIIACAALVAGEFSEGTMKMMISRPYSRAEILSAKLVATILYGLVLLITSFVLNFIFTGVLFGFNGVAGKEMFWTGSKIIYMPAVLKTLIIFGLDFLTILSYVIIAFALAAAVRSRSMATGFSLFLLLVAGNILGALAIFFSWGKYLPFVLTNFSAYIKLGSTIEGTSLAFALVSTTIYSIIFCFGGYFAFVKRDI